MTTSPSLPRCGNFECIQAVLVQYRQSRSSSLHRVAGVQSCTIGSETCQTRSYIEAARQNGLDASITSTLFGPELLRKRPPELDKTDLAFQPHKRHFQIYLDPLIVHYGS